MKPPTFIVNFIVQHRNVDCAFRIWLNMKWCYSRNFDLWKCVDFFFVRCESNIRNAFNHKWAVFWWNFQWNSKSVWIMRIVIIRDQSVSLLNKRYNKRISLSRVNTIYWITYFDSFIVYSVYFIYGCFVSIV